jgi:hypothetical protein
MIKRILTAAALVLGGTLPPAIAHATVAPELESDVDPLDGAQVIDDLELDAQRGGFRFEGLEISLGADIKTFLNGELALHTTISWTDTAVTETQIVSTALTLADADMLRNNVLANGAITMNIGSEKVYLANEGQTALIHRGDGHLQNVLINTASNVVASQEVTATLDIGGYSSFVSTIATGQLSRNLGEDISRAVSGAFGR